MRARHRERDVTFDVVNKVLTQTVVFPDGKSYTHRCERLVFETVARAIEGRGSEGVTLNALVEALDLPFTQVNVALNFMKERGCVVTPTGGGRRSYPASNGLFEDAMIEFCWLEQRSGAEGQDGEDYRVS